MQKSQPNEFRREGRSPGDFDSLGSHSIIFWGAFKECKYTIRILGSDPVDPNAYNTVFRNNPRADRICTGTLTARSLPIIFWVKCSQARMKDTMPKTVRNKARAIDAHGTGNTKAPSEPSSNCKRKMPTNGYLYL
eukprot:1161698-Pelagomonas_calceolata.AAC.5